MIGSDNSLATSTIRLTCILSTTQKVHKNKVGQSQPTLRQTPFPERNVLMLLSMYSRMFFGYGEHRKLGDAFKYYWMDDKTQFCICTLS
jgi:hypothetical protein